MDDDIILNEVATRVVPMICTFGIYVILNGHLSPGGGFAGGTIIGAALALFTVVFGIKATYSIVPQNLLIVLTSLGPLWYACVGLYGLFTGHEFLANANAGVSLGHPGALVSSGLIPLITIGVGVSVAITVVVLFAVLVEADRR